MRARSRKGKEVSKKHVEKTEIADIFRLLQITTIDRDPNYLKQLPRDLTNTQRPDGVEYRTILTNGTGRVLGSLHVELE